MDDGEEEEEEEDEDGKVLFFVQQITPCLPLASMAQKKPLSPNAAEIGPMDPNPDTPIQERRRKRRRKKKDCISEEDRGDGDKLGSGMSWTGIMELGRFS